LISLPATDTVYRDVDDVEALLREALDATQMGLSGKQAVHPNQIDPIQRAVAPDKVEIALARRRVESDAAHPAPCKGQSRSTAPCWICRR
jgi:citrate lyase beta subunit